jgi:prepilin-type N-terminal cleavage/methylation domain-containing protein
MSVRCRRGFTLIEVAVASAVLAISLMGILMICSTGIRTAKILDRVHVDAATLAAELSLTNRLEDGSSEDGDFGDFHPGYRWHREINQVQTNGLFQVDFTVWSGAGPGHDESHLSILLFRPESIPRVGGLR